jgi:hypothetical protein
VPCICFGSNHEALWGLWRLEEDSVLLVLCSHLLSETLDSTHLCIRVIVTDNHERLFGYSTLLAIAKVFFVGSNNLLKAKPCGANVVLKFLVLRSVYLQRVATTKRGEDKRTVSSST